MAQYNYTKTIRPHKLSLEIKSALNLMLDGTDGNIQTNENNVIIMTNNPLTDTQKTTLDTVINAHTIDNSEIDFDSKLFSNRFAEEFTFIERMDLAKKAPNFAVALCYHIFAEIKQIRDYLLQNEEITEAQSNLITSLFAEQNIDLDSY